MRVLSKVEHTEEGCGSQGDSWVWDFPEPALSPICSQSVNEVLESMDSPLELVEGFVGSIEVAVPWAALLTDHCTVHVSGLQLTLQPRQGPGEGRVRLRWGRAGLGTQELTGPAYPETVFLLTGPGTADSQTWTSCMTTSLQLAQECLRDGLPEPSEPPQPLEGLEMFAQTIETGTQTPPDHPAPHPSVGHRTGALDSGMVTLLPCWGIRPSLRLCLT